MAIDNGTDTMAPGNETLSLQRGENIAQLRAADTQFIRKDILPGQTVATGIFSVFHSRDKVGSNGLGLDRLIAHFLHLIRHLSAT